MSTIYEFSAKDITGQLVQFSDFKNKPLLIVNTASKCGFTPQFKGLEELYQSYQSKGFVVLGFPCNQFGSQDPGSNQEITQFCTLNYHVTFPMMAKVEVNGPKADPLFQWLTKAAPGLLGSTAIKWNFTKFLINREGMPNERFAPNTTPDSLRKKIEVLL
jgi:glutathione peroxidase